MGHSSINEDFKGLVDVRQESQHAKLYRQATEDATFLRNLMFVKQDSDVSSVRSRSSSVGHQEYALYRQKYLVMYSPFRTLEKKKEEKKSMKKKINKLFIVKLKKENAKTTTEPKSNKDKASSSSVGFLESVLRFLRFLR